MKRPLFLACAAVLFTSCTTLKKPATNLEVREVSPAEAQDFVRKQTVSLADRITAESTASKLRKGMSWQQAQKVVGQFDDSVLTVFSVVENIGRNDGSVKIAVPCTGLILKFAVSSDGKVSLDSWEILPVTNSESK